MFQCFIMHIGFLFRVHIEAIQRLATYATDQIDRCLGWKVGICQWIFILSIVFEVQQFYLCHILITRFSTSHVVVF
jgi:hypothetical protein